MPPEYEMVAFLAYAQGFKKAQERGEAQSAAVAALAAPAQREQAHPGGALVMMFPDGKIRV